MRIGRLFIAMEVAKSGSWQITSADNLANRIWFSVSTVSNDGDTLLTIVAGRFAWWFSILPSHHTLTTPTNTDKL